VGAENSVSLQISSFAEGHQVLALARSGLRQTDAWVEACSSDSSAA
jgi:hypothetical protein